MYMHQCKIIMWKKNVFLKKYVFIIFIVVIIIITLKAPRL